MTILGHTAQLERIDGRQELPKDPQQWGSLFSKAEYLNGFRPVQAWQIEIQQDQLGVEAIEQLAEAFHRLSGIPFFSDNVWLSIKFPELPIDQDDWRPFFQLLQVVDRFKGEAVKNLTFSLPQDMTLPGLWKLNKKHELEQAIKDREVTTLELLHRAYYLRDQVNKAIELTVQNNQPYFMKTHSYATAGIFPVVIKRWLRSGIDFSLSVPSASLACWYREQYGYDGPIPSLNTHHRASVDDYWGLEPQYISLSGMSNTPESFYRSIPIGSRQDDIDWELWLSSLKTYARTKNLPVVIDLVSEDNPERWSLCQASAAYLQRYLSA
jgi:hypothetical protein